MVDPTSAMIGGAGVLLVKAIADYGIPTIFGPHLKRVLGRVDVDLKVHERLALAQADFDARPIASGAVRYDSTTRRLIHVPQDEDYGDLPLFSVERQATEISDMLALRQEVNVGNALLKAFDHLEGYTGPLPEGSVSSDWFHSWRSGVGDVSDERMQDVWARLLAGEVKEPGRYSLRTHAFLRSMTSSDAAKLERLFSFSILGSIIVTTRAIGHLRVHAGISYSDCLEFEEIGILVGTQSGLSLQIFSSVPTGAFLGLFSYGARHVTLTHPDPATVISLSSYKLTAVATQLLDLCKIEPDYDFLSLVLTDIRELRTDLTVTVRDVSASHE